MVPIAVRYYLHDAQPDANFYESADYSSASLQGPVHRARLAAGRAPCLRSLRTDGDLMLDGVELAASQAVAVPRVLDDPDHEPDAAGPEEELAAIFGRTRAALFAWMQALDHLCQFGSDAILSPSQVVAPHSADEGAPVRVDGRSAGRAARTRSPTPEQSPAGAVPGDDGLRLDDEDHLAKQPEPADEGSDEPPVEAADDELLRRTRFSARSAARGAKKSRMTARRVWRTEVTVP